MDIWVHDVGEPRRTLPLARRSVTGSCRAAYASSTICPSPQRHKPTHIITRRLARSARALCCATDRLSWGVGGLADSRAPRRARVGVGLHIGVTGGGSGGGGGGGGRCGAHTPVHLLNRQPMTHEEHLRKRSTPWEAADPDMQHRVVVCTTQDMPSQYAAGLEQVSSDSAYRARV